MNCVAQLDAMSTLYSYSKNKKCRSVLISGPKGSGKTYLAKHYASLLRVPDFVVCEPKVNEVKECIEHCITNSNPIVVCIENLDTGVAAAAFALLTFLEEPSSNAHVVVTCRDTQSIPDTIVSRCLTVSMSPPTHTDVNEYVKEKYPELINSSSSRLISMLTSFSDVDLVSKLQTDQLNYILNIPSELNFSKGISSNAWSLSKYPNGGDTPIGLVMQYLIHTASNSHIRNAAISCAKDLELGRLSTSAVLSRFLIECKYIE